MVSTIFKIIIRHWQESLTKDKKVCKPYKNVCKSLMCTLFERKVLESPEWRVT